MSDPGLIIERAIEALKGGQLAQARSLLTQAIKNDPREARAWFWLSACWSEPEKQRYCLEKALALQPDAPQIIQALNALSTAPPGIDSPAPLPAQPTPPEPPTNSPTPPDEPVVEPQPAERPPDARKPRNAPPPKKKRANRLAQVITLLFLTLLAIAAIGVLLVVFQQTEGDLFPWMQPERPRLEAPVELPTFAMPPTWTPTLAPAASDTPLAPSATLLSPTDTPFTPTPVPSITPFFALWRIIIGQSAQNRPILVFRFGAGKHERLIVAGIHGGSEANTIALADQLIGHLQKNPTSVPEDVSLYILRSLNPDGEALGDIPEARFNAHGVDLNRNFDRNWKASWSGADCVSTAPATAGPSAASEPETQALLKFLQEHPIEALINYHSAGLGIFPAEQTAASASVKLAQAIAKISPYAYPPVKTNCEFTGTLVDSAVHHGVQAAVDLELNSSSDSEFETNLKILDLLLAWQP